MEACLVLDPIRFQIDWRLRGLEVLAGREDRDFYRGLIRATLNGPDFSARSREAQVLGVTTHYRPLSCNGKIEPFAFLARDRPGLILSESRPVEWVEIERA